MILFFEINSFILEVLQLDGGNIEGILKWVKKKKLI